MSEISALKKYSCPACGAEARWDAGKQALVCPFCGTVSPAELARDGSLVKENDLAVAMRAIPEEGRGWEREKTSVKCQSCQAISVFEPERVAQRCEFCGSPSVVPYEETKAAIRPESLLQFKVSETQIRENVRQWYRSRWFAPNRLKSGALTDTVHGVYVPYWTFDAQVAADWTAESGYYYYETESYRDSNGRSQTRQVRKIRWQPSAGHLDHFFDDELVPATRGVNPELLGKVDAFPTKELVPYDAGYVSGWVVEQYQIDLIAAARHARQQMDQKLQGLCAQEVPGDTHRNLQVAADYSAQTFKHILVPVWLLNYNYGSKTFQVVVNGFTGDIAGKHPLSWVKIFFAVMAVLIVLLVILWLGNQ